MRRLLLRIALSVVPVLLLVVGLCSDGIVTVHAFLIVNDVDYSSCLRQQQQILVRNCNDGVVSSSRRRTTTTTKSNRKIQELYAIAVPSKLRRRLRGVISNNNNNNNNSTRNHYDENDGNVFQQKQEDKGKQQSQRQRQQQRQRQREQEQPSPPAPPNIDAMRARAGVLRRSILQQQLELQQLERQIICCSSSSSSSSAWDSFSPLLADTPIELLSNTLNRTVSTFSVSWNVLLRKINSVRLGEEKKVSSVSLRKRSVSDYATHQAKTGVRIVRDLIQNPNQIYQLAVDPHTATLVPHAPAIFSQLDKLESHLPPILERVLNNKRHLPSIEPYLDEILERFDDIEPHLPWILDNIDTLAPYTGLLLKHIDELLLYANVDENEAKDHFNSTTQYALAEQLLPYLEFYVSRLDTVGPHLPLLRPHIPKLLKYNRIGKMTPYIDQLFALGYKDNLGASANMDVLLFWVGWTLRIPFLPRIFFAIPGSTRMVTFLANRLPKRFVRGYCSNVQCQVDNDYGGEWNQLLKN